MNYEPIIKSMLDDDLYKINMGSVVFHLFPNAWVTYEFINRGKTIFPSGFAKELKEQVQAVAAIRLTAAEALWMQSIPYLRRTYIEWMRGYQMNPEEVLINQTAGILSIKIEGPWYRTIYWEVKLMAMISELYFKMTGEEADQEWHYRMGKKGNDLQEFECHWIDFGTRRRFSYEIQDALVKEMKHYRGFLGTSNPHLAMKHGVKPHGTFAHECVMAMAALYGPRMANHMWQRHWSDHFDGNVGVALTDTFTTDVFLRDFGTYEARLFDGVRQDSGDPINWAIQMKHHYEKLGISTRDKRFVFSDGLDTDKYISIDTRVRLFAQPVGGIGTHFTNDVGEHVKPLNMVIKLTSANFGQGSIDVVKLSDNEGKHTGNPDAIAQVKRELGIKLTFTQTSI